MSKWQVGLVLACFPILCPAQSPSSVSSAPLPEVLIFRLYPDNLPGRRGHQLDIARIAHSAGVVTARITMHGLGQDRCRIQGHPAEGSFDGTKLVLKAKVDASDNITCPMVFELIRASDGKFEGRFTNSQFSGNVKPD